MLPNFRKNRAFWKVPRLRPSVLLVRATCRCIRAWSTVRMILTGDNRSTRRKTCLSATLSATNLIWTGMKSYPSLRGDRPLLIWIIHTNSVPASRKILSVPVTKHIQLVRGIGDYREVTRHTQTHTAATVQTGHWKFGGWYYFIPKFRNIHHSSTSHRAYSDSRKVNESIRINKCTKNYTISTSVKIYTSTDSLRVKLNPRTAMA